MKKNILIGLLACSLIASSAYAVMTSRISHCRCNGVKADCTCKKECKCKECK